MQFADARRGRQSRVLKSSPETLGMGSAAITSPVSTFILKFLRSIQVTAGILWPCPRRIAALHAKTGEFGLRLYISRLARTLLRLYVTAI